MSANDVKKIKIGRISGAHGLRGELKLYHDSGDEDAVRRLSSLFLCAEGTETAYNIEGLRMQKRTPILKLKGVDGRNDAEALIGCEVYASIDDARPDEEDAFLVSDLIGLETRLADKTGVAVGKIRSVIDNPAHDILEIETDGGVRLLPLVDVFVKAVCPAGGFIVILPPEGWAD